ncbi:MAG: hypothetical protein WBG57_08615 [Ornithinimicrobium sp.]
MSTAPSLSVVVVSPSDFAQVRRSVRHLSGQDTADQIELILVATSPASVADHHPWEFDRFAAVRIVAYGLITNVDRAAALGVSEASADIVAVVEDHAFVGPGWARAVMEAYRAADWVSVGSVMENANPSSSLSWANLLLGYGWWVDPARCGAIFDVPGHNGSYARSALAALSEELPDLMVRGGGLHDRLRAAGGRMYLAADARIAHLNPSRPSSTAKLRYNAGRLYGHIRAETERWSPVKRAAYALACIVIPYVRLQRLHAEHLAVGRAHHHLTPRILPGLLLALSLDAAGQAAGYLAGPGRAQEVAATFEMDRMRHLSRADHARFTSETCP